jgi:hypothetical protein
MGPLEEVPCRGLPGKFPWGVHWRASSGGSPMGGHLASPIGRGRGVYMASNIDLEGSIWPVL